MGLAVSKKGLTLKELLQQTSHHNGKVRKDALMGMKDLFLKHPEELKLHRYAIIEKLRERVNDEDKVVRETLHQLLKSVILPGCNEVLQNYVDILRKNQFYLEEKSKLKNVLKVHGQEMLHAFESDKPTKVADFSVGIDKLKDFVPVLVNCFQDFVPLIYSTQQLDAQ